jgi:hypothetical protein
LGHKQASAKAIFSAKTIYQSALFTVVSVGMSAVAIAQQFTAPTFNQTQWDPAVVLPGITNNAGGPPPTVTLAQAQSGGNPGKYSSVQLTFSGSGATGTVTVGVGHMRKGPLYTPALSGELASLAVQYDLGAYQDKYMADNQPGFGESGSCVGFAFLIRQGGIYYRSAIDYACRPGYNNPSVPGGTQGQNSWLSFNKGNLTAANFVQVSPLGAGQPDFSCDASPIQFGYLTITATKGAQPQATKAAGIDNLSVTANPANKPAISCACKLKILASTSQENLSKGAPVSLRYSVQNIGAKECETARIASYWLAQGPFGQLWTEATPGLWSKAPSADWNFTTSGFPVGTTIGNSQLAAGPSIPTGDMYRVPNKPLLPSDSAHVYDGKNVGNAIQNELNCAITVDGIGGYQAARQELYTAAQNTALWTSSGWSAWAKNINKYFAQQGNSGISCVGFDVK